MLNAQCPMRNAQSPMRNAQCPNSARLGVGRFASIPRRTHMYHRPYAVLACCFVLLGPAACARRAPSTAPPAGVGIPAPAPIDPLVQLRSDLASATRQAGVRRGVWGVAVHSLDRDERLFELNPAALLVPASAAKVVSAAAAADAVGWDYRFETVLQATGATLDNSLNGVIDGDLIVVGSGDPSIGGRAGDDISVFVNAVKARGIRRINGRIIGDDNALEEPR